MRRFPVSWDRTLAALGFKRKASRIQSTRSRKLRSESLEPRRLLSGSPNEPVALRPEYVLSGWAEDDSPEVFQVSTEYGEGDTPIAVLSLTDDAEKLEGTLQELTLELRLGNTALAQQEVLLSFADDRFVDRFYLERVEEAEKEIAIAPDTAVDSWLGLLNDEGEFSDLAGDTNKLSKTTERFSSIAAVEANRSDETAASETEKTRLYVGLERAAEEIQVKREEATTELERAEAEVDAAKIQRAGLLLGRKLQEDLSSVDIALKESAQQAINEVFATSDSYHTLFAGYGINRELVKRTDGTNATDFTIGSIEEDSYSPNEGLRVELGGAPAIVQATLTRLSFAASGAAANFEAELDSSNDTFVDQGATTSTNNGNTLEVDGTNSAEKHALAEFDLSPYAGTVPELAELVLNPISGSGINYLHAHSDLWGAFTTTSWSESSLSWDDYETDLQAGFGDEIDSWQVTPSSPETLDVTETVQRSVVFGDSNFNGSFDYAGPNGDINAFYQAVRDQTAYTARYDGQALLTTNLGGLKEGLVYRNDANLDNQITNSDKAIFFQRHGVSQADYNLDGVSDARDYHVWASGFGGSPTAFTDGDGNFDGEINGIDYVVWVENKGEEYTGPTDPAVTFRVSAETDASAEYASSETANGPELNINFAPQVVISDFTTDGKDLQLNYDVKYGDANNAKLAVFQIIDGVANELFSNESLTGTVGNGYTHAVNSSFTIVNPEADYRLVASITSDNGLTRVKELSGGVFTDELDNWHVIGTDIADAVELEAGSIDLSGGLTQAVDLTTETVASIYVNLKGGDDTYEVPSATSASLDLFLTDRVGIDSLDLSAWSSPTISLNGGHAGTLDDLTGQTVDLTFDSSSTIEVVQAFDISNISGAGYSTPLVVDTLADAVDGVHSEGEKSLREALLIAATIAGPQTVSFAPEMFESGPASLVLGDADGSGALAPYETATQLVVNSEVAIEGPGTDLLTITGGDSSRVLKALTMPVHVSYLTIANGYVEGSDGGGIYSNTDLTLEGVVVRDSRSDRVGSTGGRGGGVYSDGGDLTLVGVTVDSNGGEYQGGGVYFKAQANEHLIVDRSTISNNDALSGGSGSMRGGGLFVYAHGSNAGSVEIVNSTVSGNSALLGGGVVFSGRPTVDITSTTITKNEVTQSVAGLWNVQNDATITLHNTIVAGNLGGDASNRDIRYSIEPSSSHNLVGLHNGTGIDTSPSSGNLIIGGADPGLSALADNGGPAWTHAILSTSPAIDAGDANHGSSTDQRGRERRFDGNFDQAYTPDIGAYELSDERIALLDSGDVIVQGAAGSDVITLDATTTTINGSTHTLPTGASGGLTIRGQEGDDQITVNSGYASGVVLAGGDGSDTLTGGGGDDILLGEKGEDYLFGAGGEDVLHGGLGNDLLFGGAGSDVIHGDDGEDYIDGNEASDQMYGGAGNDYMAGGSGNDLLIGGDGDDQFNFDEEDQSTPPEIEEIAGLMPVRNGQGVGLAIPVEDVQDASDNLTFSVEVTGTSTVPAISYSITGGVFRWEPTGLDSGTYTVTVTVEDSDGRQASTAFELVLEDYNYAPPAVSMDIDNRYSAMGQLVELGVPTFPDLTFDAIASDTQTADEDIDYGGALSSDGTLQPDWIAIQGTSRRVVIEATDEPVGRSPARTKKEAYYTATISTTASNETIIANPAIDLSFSTPVETSITLDMYDLYHNAYLNNWVHSYWLYEHGPNSEVYPRSFDWGTPEHGNLTVPDPSKPWQVVYTPDQGFEGIERWEYSNSHALKFLAYSTGEYVDSNNADIVVEVGKAVRANIDLGVPEENEEEGLGKIVAVNSDDDNGNYTDDSKELFGGVSGENDLVEASLSYWLRDDAYQNDYLARLVVSAGNVVKIWDTATKDNEIIPSTENLSGTEWLLNEMPATVWVEGVGAGSASLELVIEGPETSLFTNQVAPSRGAKAPTSDSDAVTISVFEIDLDIDRTQMPATPIVLANSTNTDTSLDTEFIQLEEVRLSALLPAVTNTALYGVQIIVEGAARVWEDAARTVEIDLSQLIGFGSSSSIERTFYVDTDGAPADIQLVAQLDSTDSNYAPDTPLVAKERATSFLFSDNLWKEFDAQADQQAASVITDRLNEIGNLIKASLQDRIDALPLSDPNRSILETQKSNVDAWLDTVGTRSRGVAFQLWAHSSKVLVPKRPQARLPQALGDLLENGTEPAPAGGAIPPEEVTFVTKFDSGDWQGAIGSLLEGNLDALEDYILSPARVETLGVRFNRVTSSGEVAFVQVGLKNLGAHDTWDGVVSEPGKNTYELRYGLPNIKWRALEISSSLGIDVKPDEWDDNLLNFELDINY